MESSIEFAIELAESFNDIGILLRYHNRRF
jgi:hypothetical protein